MLLPRSLPEIEAIPDAAIRTLLTLRFEQLADGACLNEQQGLLIVVEPEDSVEVVEEAAGCPILNDPFGEDDFMPAYEVLEAHFGCFELTFILTDDGYFVAIFIPTTEGIDDRLLGFCREFAVPSQPAIS